MPFPFNGNLLIQGNLLRVIQVDFQMYRNIMLVFLSPISIWARGFLGNYLELEGRVKIMVNNRNKGHPMPLPFKNKNKKKCCKQPPLNESLQCIRKKKEKNSSTLYIF